VSRPAVFLDRDGSMIRDVGYLNSLDQVDWFPWSIDAIRLLKRAGFVVCVVTNQGGIGLALCDEPTVVRIHEAMHEDLAAAGAIVDGWYFCPHHPRAVIPDLRIDCECRKPKPGLLYRASERHDIDLARSFIVGDKVSDVALAEPVGARSVLVRTGYGEGELKRRGGRVPEATYVADDLMAATSWILTRGASGETSGSR
jgi:D-glycero-D-manno-heptose 1,7-bisphosphate phosphatase